MCLVLFLLFMLFIYRDTTVPQEWGESDPCYIANSEVRKKIRCFSNDFFKVRLIVTNYSGSEVAII